MAAITKPAQRLRNSGEPRGLAWGLMALEVAVAYELGRQAGWWVLGVLVILAIELRGSWLVQARLAARLESLWEGWSGAVMGLGAVLIIILVPRLATQIVVAALYAGWLVWRQRKPEVVSQSFVHLLLEQAVIFEAIFLMAAIWQTPGWLTLVLVWVAAYAGVYATLTRRGDRLAGVMAATWGVVATEVAWVLLLWLITYTLTGGYVLVPQPALVLTALAYVMGSILASSRQGNLSRARLAEYLTIAAVLVIIVVAGTSWRGNV